MAFDEDLAGRVRLVLADAPDLYERRMFGGLAFMLSEHMVCGIVGDELMLRLGPEAAGRALDGPYVRPMDFTGRPMKAMVLVAPAALSADDELLGWLAAAREFVGSLPPKRRR